jgi:hypothetical protein
MNMSLRGVLPGTARHIVPEAKRVGGQVWFLPKQSPNNRGLLRREEQEPSSQ